jgi:conjugative transfer pilus assembly protein TraH
MKMFATFFLSPILAIGLVLTAQAEDWVDDWFRQSTYSRPNTYNTQKRGYVTGGNLSLRYQQSTDHVVNVTLPRFKKGCGGIDLFMGSMNYLDADRLEEKFNNIMSAGIATYAFDLALNVLCEPCAKELKSLEAIVDRINQLQIDDCKATKAVVAIAENETGIGDSEKNTEAITDFLVSTTGEDYRKVTDDHNDKTVDQALSDAGKNKRDLIEGCPDALKDIFFTEGTLLENLASRIGIDTGKVQLMRAMIGDVLIEDDLRYGAIAPCPQNNPTNLDAIIYGDFYVRRNGNCVKDQINIGGDMFPSIYEWAKANLIEIADAMKDKGVLTPGNELFINTIPHPVLVQITTDIISQGNDFDANQTAEHYAYMASVIFARSLMRDLYNDLYNMLQYAQIANFNQMAADTTCGDPPKPGCITCASSLSGKAQMMAEKMKDRVLTFSTMINADYRAALAGVMESAEHAQTTRENRDYARSVPLRKVSE